MGEIKLGLKQAAKDLHDAAGTITGNRKAVYEINQVANFLDSLSRALPAANPKRRNTGFDFENVRALERKIKAATEHVRQAQLHYYEPDKAIHLAGKAVDELKGTRPMLTKLGPATSTIYRKYNAQIVAARRTANRIILTA
jgi:cell division septum initiation protein DivIVA